MYLYMYPYTLLYIFIFSPTTHVVVDIIIFLLIINNLSILHRHALPMFTSLLNTVCAYDPVGYGVPYNHLLFTDSLEPLVDVALQILIVTLDHDTTGGAPLEEGAVGDNLFINYLSRIHRDEGESIL